MAYIPSFVREAHEEGKRELLLQSLLEQHFGFLPEWARLEIARASETTLDPRIINVMAWVQRPIVGQITVTRALRL